MFQEGNERGRDGDHLAGRNVHQGHFFTQVHFHFALDAHGNVFVKQVAFGIGAGVGLSHNLTAFTRGIKVHHFVGNAGIAHNAVGRFDKAVVVHLGKGGQRNDKTDVRAFRRFDGADTAIVRGVHVAYFKACAFTGKTAGAQSRKTTLVRYFGERVGLVHELRELRGAKEFLEHSRHRLGIDKVVGHERGNFLKAHALLDGAFHTHKADAVLVFNQFANQTHTAVAKVVDVVGGAVAVLQLHQHLDGGEDVVVGQRAQVVGFVQVKALVKLVTAHGRKVVVVAVAEQVVKEAGRNFRGRRRRRAQTTVDFFLCLELVWNTVLNQGVADGRRSIRTLGMQHGDAGNASFAEAVEQTGGDFVGSFGQNFTGLGVGHVNGKEHGIERIGANLDGFDASFTDQAPAALGDGLASLDNNIALGVDDIGVGVVLAVQVFAYFPEQAAGRLDAVVLVRVEVFKDLFLAHAHGLEQDGGGHFAAAVNADVQNILVVEVKVEPRAAHGNDAAGIEHLAAGVGLATVVLKDDARRTLQLVNDDALGAVDDKRALFRHQGQGAKIDILLFDVADGAVARSFIGVVNHQAHLDAHGCLVGQPLGNALGLVVLGFANFIADEFKTGGLIEILNGEDGVEYTFQPFLWAAVGI